MNKWCLYIQCVSRICMYNRDSTVREGRKHVEEVPVGQEVVLSRPARRISGGRTKEMKPKPLFKLSFLCKLTWQLGRYLPYLYLLLFNYAALLWLE